MSPARTAETYDVILYDSVGMPYTGSTPDHSGLGGSEFEMILLAEALSRRGHRVLVLNQTLLPAVERGIEYANHAAARQVTFSCRVLVIARYSAVPPIRHDRLVVAVSDMAGTNHLHFDPYFAASPETTLVALSAWHRSLFPARWNAAVIPYILPERVYSSAEKPNPRRFVYASAALKGLRETLDAWLELKRDPALVDAELVVCNPGYDSVDEGALARAGVTFLGSLPFDRVVHELASSAGLFYVNRFPETFCIVAALAEALGRRVHILSTQGLGALRTTARSPLITEERDAFLATFREAYAKPDDPRWYAPPHDYHEATVMKAWLRVLRLDGAVTPTLDASVPEPTVCLNMIVKNEAHVIERCLDSVKSLLSTWVIVDTGSTDGTQDVIRRHMAKLGIPGELHERPWKDFGSNRTEALELARGKADYLVVVDADDTLEISPGFSRRQLTMDCHELRVEDHGSVYTRGHFFRSDRDFRYEGVLHEVLRAGIARDSGLLEGVVYKRIGGGARSTDAKRFLRDAEVLEKALRAEPANARYAFYLAQTWRDGGELEKALVAYEHRATMVGWDEENWSTRVEIARLYEKLGKPDDQVIAAYLRAHEERPTRAEALCALAFFCRTKQRFALAHVFAGAAMGIPRPPRDFIWIDEAVYQWRALDEYAIASYYVGRHREAIEANQRLLASPHLPETERERVRTNMQFSTAIVGT